MEQLIALARLPLTRLPKLSLRDRIKVFCGLHTVEGEAIPQDQLALPQIWQPAIEAVGVQRAKLSAETLLNWLYLQADGNGQDELELFDTEAAQQLLDCDPELANILALKEGHLAFRPEVLEQDRAALCRSVKSRYRPMILR